MTRRLVKLLGPMSVAWVIGVTVAAQVVQRQDLLNAPPEMEPVVRNAPYSGEGVTKVKLIMFDGTHVEQSVTAKFYRDSAGRVRREQAVIGLEALDPAADVRAVVHLFDPVARAIYTLIPGSTTAMLISMDDPRPGSGPAPKHRLAGPVQQSSLGTKQINGLTATGSRQVVTIGPNTVGNDRPIEIVDERWESTELKVVLQSLHHDPRTGDVEYTLTKISRDEPPAELFKVPAHYKIQRLPVAER